MSVKEVTKLLIANRYEEALKALELTGLLKGGADRRIRIRRRRLDVFSSPILWGVVFVVGN